MGGALQNNATYAAVLDEGTYKYIIADLETFRINFGRKRMGTLCASLRDFVTRGEWRPLTRFRRGHPTPAPDRRRTNDMELVQTREVEEVVDRDAINVRSLAGDLVFSMARAHA